MANAEQDAKSKTPAEIQQEGSGNRTGAQHLFDPQRRKETVEHVKPDQQADERKRQQDMPPPSHIDKHLQR